MACLQAATAEQLETDKGFVMGIVDGCADIYPALPFCMQAEPDVAQRALGKYPHHYRLAPAEVKADWRLAAAAVIASSSLLSEVPPSVLAEPEFARLVLDVHPTLLREGGMRRWMQHEELVMGCLALAPTLYRHLTEDLQLTPRIYRHAVKAHPQNLCTAPAAVWRESNLVRYALRRDASVMAHMPLTCPLASDVDFIMELVTLRADAPCFFPRGLMRDERLVLAMVHRRPDMVHWLTMHDGLPNLRAVVRVALAVGRASVFKAPAKRSLMGVPSWAFSSPSHMRLQAFALEFAWDEAYEHIVGGLGDRLSSSTLLQLDQHWPAFTQRAFLRDWSLAERTGLTEHPAAKYALARMWLRTACKRVPSHPFGAAGLPDIVREHIFWMLAGKQRVLFSAHAFRPRPLATVLEAAFKAR